MVSVGVEKIVSLSCVGWASLAVVVSGVAYRSVLAGVGRGVELAMFGSQGRRCAHVFVAPCGGGAKKPVLPTLSTRPASTLFAASGLGPTTWGGKGRPLAVSFD